MSTQGYIYDDSFIADEAIEQFRVVVHGSAKGRVALPSAQDVAGIVGVTQHSTTASGDTVLVRRAGLTKVKVAGASIALGEPLRAFDIRGMADENNVWASGDGVLGYANETSTASGDIIECWLAIRQLLGD